MRVEGGEGVQADGEMGKWGELWWSVFGGLPSVTSIPGSFLTGSSQGCPAAEAYSSLQAATLLRLVWLAASLCCVRMFLYFVLAVMCAAERWRKRDCVASGRQREMRGSTRRRSHISTLANALTEPSVHHPAEMSPA